MTVGVAFLPTAVKEGKLGSLPTLPFPDDDSHEALFKIKHNNTVILSAFIEPEQPRTILFLNRLMFFDDDIVLASRAAACEYKRFTKMALFFSLDRPVGFLNIVVYSK